MPSQIENALIEMLGCEVDELPSLPEVAYQTCHLTADDSHSSDELAKVIGRDPSFASRLLKIANSAGYGLPSQVTSVKRAILLLGVQEVRELALTIAAFAAAGSSRPIRRRVQRGKLWNHSKMVGMICETLARNELKIGGGFYIHGLLHDIGKVALDAFRSKEFDQVLDLVDQNKMSWLKAERQVLGFDHCQVGEAMLTHWHFPPALISSVTGHHTPWDVPQNQEVAALVFLADILANFTEKQSVGVSPQETQPFLLKLGWNFDRLMAERVLDSVRNMDFSISIDI